MQQNAVSDSVVCVRVADMWECFFSRVSHEKPVGSFSWLLLFKTLVSGHNVPDVQNLLFVNLGTRKYF